MSDDLDYLINHLSEIIDKLNESTTSEEIQLEIVKAIDIAESLDLPNSSYDEDAATWHAERLAATLALVLYDAHPTFGSTAQWGGGVGGQTITSHCSITQGASPGTEWAEYDLPSIPLRDFLTDYPEFNLHGAKEDVVGELRGRLRHG